MVESKGRKSTNLPLSYKLSLFSAKLGVLAAYPPKVIVQFLASLIALAAKLFKALPLPFIFGQEILEVILRS
jgi:hypothetical protein